MKPRSLRSELVSLILLALLPLLVVSGHTAWMEWQRVENDAKEEVIRLGRLFANNQQRIIEAARQLLTALADLEGVQNQKPNSCEPLFAKLLRENSVFSIVAAMDAEGNVFSSAPDSPTPLNNADRIFFKRAMASRDFSVGDLVVGRLTGKPTVHFSLPVINDSGEVTGVVYLGLDLNALSEFGSRVSLPVGGSVSIISSQGICLMRYPDPKLWVGHAGDSSWLKKTLEGGKKEGTVLWKGRDGVKRIYAVNRVDAPGGDSFYITVGIAEKEVFAPLYRNLLREAAALAAVLLVTLFGVWLLAGRFMVRPASHLVGVARAIGAGNLAVRSSLGSGAGEFREIGTALNQMADTLARRIADLNEVQQELRASQDELEQRVEIRTEEVRHAREQLVDAIESMGAGVAMFGPDHRLVICNSTYRKMLMGSEEITKPGIHFEALLRGYVRGVGMAEDQATMSWIQSRLAAFYTADGSLYEQKMKGRWIQVSYHRMRDGGVVTLRTDITARVETQQALERTAAELRRSNSELEQFAYVASHDLQEPLRMVASYTQLLARRYQGQLDQTAQDFIGYAVDGAKRMQAFIQDLLQYSRVGTHGRAFEAIDLNTTIQRAIENLRFVIEEKSAEITVESMPVLVCDSVQMAQLFQNLIGNALKFSGEAPPRIEIEAVRREREREWEFAVRDHGIGIDPQSFERIFVIFQRLHTRQEYEGTGVGLAICKKIVERHGGRIWVESKPGEGATFRFTIRDQNGENFGSNG